MGDRALERRARLRHPVIVESAVVDVPVLAPAGLVELARLRLLSTFCGAARDCPSIVVPLGVDTPDSFDALVADTELGTLPAVLIGIGSETDPAAVLVDVVVPDDSAAQRLVELIRARPVASTALALLLRHGEQRSVSAGLIAESTTYSTLEAGAEFAAWRERRGPTTLPPDGAAPVLVHEDGPAIDVVLNRPARHNAVNVGLSEGLVQALTAALGQPGRAVVLRGNGPSFCSGGDLAEFGAFPDPARAHIIRVTRSAGQLIHQLRDRIEVHLHGACLGAGIELPAFAGTVVADPGARLGLPEIGLGLVPGAGGTVSLPRRIGRHRTAWLALTGDAIDAQTALQWGLVDRITT